MTVGKALSVAVVVIAPTVVVVLMQWAYAIIDRRLERRRPR